MNDDKQGLRERLEQMGETARAAEPIAPGPWSVPEHHCAYVEDRDLRIVAVLTAELDDHVRARHIATFSPDAAAALVAVADALRNAYDVGAVAEWIDVEGAKQAEATRDGAQKAASDAVDRARIAEEERDKALAKYQFMVDRAANEKLDGYRELAMKVANAERERDAWYQVARMWEMTARKGADLAIDIEKLYHPDSDNEEIAALIVWSESVRQLPSMEEVRGGDAEKEGDR